MITPDLFIKRKTDTESRNDTIFIPYFQQMYHQQRFPSHLPVMHIGRTYALAVSFIVCFLCQLSRLGQLLIAQPVTFQFRTANPALCSPPDAISILFPSTTSFLNPENMVSDPVLL